MRKRLLSFCLIFFILISNMADIYAIENNGTGSGEEVRTEMESPETEAGDEDAENSASEVTSEYTDETTNDSVSSEENTSTFETETEEESTSEQTSETITEEESDLSLESTRFNYHVDKEAPYSGEYLIITNNSKIYSESGASVGASSSIIDEVSLAGDNEDSADIIDDNEPLIPDEGFEGYEPPELSDNDEISLEETYILGDQRDFYLKNASDKGDHLTKCECVSIGSHCIVWVPVDDPIYKSSRATMRSYMNKLSREFDNKYSTVTEAFGDLSYADKYGDEDGKVALICYDIYGDAATKSSGYTSGLFSGRDMAVLFSNATGNNIDCLHLDSWQAMKRSEDGQTLGDISYVYETMVHELQHMIMWSNMRKLEASNGAISFTMNVPDWINEGYSEAAVHLCYGGSTGRISRYNQGAVKAGKRSLLKWNSDLDSYALSYLFAQYIRCQYAKISDSDGREIYLKAINAMTTSSDKVNSQEGAAILDAIAGELGISAEELIENFWIALFMLDANGPYGFNGEAWAEEIEPQVTASRVASLKPGSSQVIAISKDYNPTGQADNIVYAGLSRKNPVSVKDSLTIEGVTSLRTIGDSIELSAVSDKKGPVDVIWSIPNEADRELIEISQDGRVRALNKYGSALVRASLKKDSSVYVDAVIEVLHDKSKDIQLTTKEVKSDYGEKTFDISYISVDNARIHYTIGKTEADVNDELLPAEGLKIREAGPVYINLLVTAEGHYDTTVSASVSLERMPSPVIKTSVTDDAKCIVDLSASSSEGEIYYTINGSAPDENSYRYGSTAVKFPIDNVSRIRAVIKKKGYLDSYIAEKSLDEYPRVEFDDIVARPIYGGFKMEIASNDKKLELRYTLDGSSPSRKSPIFPLKGLGLNVGQHIILKVTGWKDGYIPTTKICEFDLEKLDKPRLNSEYVGYLNSYRISIESDAEEDAIITYRINNGEDISYKEPFYIDAESDNTISAYVLGMGVARSDAESLRLNKVIPPYRRLTAIPRTISNSITLNKQQAGDISAIVSLMALENEEVLSCSLSGKGADAFEVKHMEEDEWKITLKDSALKNGTYKLSLLMRGTEYEEEPAREVKLAVKLIDKTPAVSLKKVTFYKLYTGTIVPLSVSSKDGDIEIIGLKNKTEGFTDNFELLDSNGDGALDSIRMTKAYDELSKDNKNKPVCAGLLTVKVAGYKEQDIALNIAVNAAKPKLGQEVANPKYNYRAIQEDQGRVSLRLTINNAQNKKVDFIPTEVGLNKDSKLYAKIADLLDLDNPISISHDGNLIIKLNTAKELKPANYQVPVYISGESDIGSFNKQEFIIKFAIEKENMSVKASLVPAKLSLNKQLDDHAYANVKISSSNILIKDIICTPEEAKGKSNLDDKVKLRYNQDKQCLEAYYDNYENGNGIMSTSYIFRCKPEYISIGSNKVIESQEELKVTVNITNAKAKLTARPKGQINVLNRENTFVNYSLSKTGFKADLAMTDADKPLLILASPDKLAKNEVDGSKLLEIRPDYSINRDSAYLNIGLKEDTEVIRGSKYVFRIGVLLENGAYIYTDNLKLTPVQPNAVTKQKSIPTLYRNVNMRKRVAYISLDPGSYEIEDIELNAARNSKLPAGLKIELSESDKKLIKVTLSSNDVKAKKYSISLNLIYKNEMKEKDGKPKIYNMNCNVIVK